jgi:uncharacterized repeat protein (TIGR02543 family)
MINVFKKVLMTTACVLFIATVSAQDKSAEESNAPVNETSVAAESAVDPAALSAELSSQKFLLTYKLNGRVYYERSVAFGTVIQTIDAPVKEGFVFTGWNGSPATMPAQNVVINGSLVAANAEQPTQSELLAKK